ELMVLMVALFSAAGRRRLRLAAPPALPKTKPKPPPVLAPTGAGMLTAKLGTLTPVRPWLEPSGSSAAPAMATILGKIRPVGLPKVGAMLMLPPHWMPAERVKLVA